MKKILFFCALANVMAGVFLRQMPGALPILRAADGSWIYPQSSGSDDVHLLAACALVSLDGSLWAAARSGYPLPLLVVCLAYLPVLFWLRPLFRQPAHQSD